MAQLLLTHSSQFHRSIHVGGALPLSMRIGKFFLFFSMTLMIGVISFVYLVKFTEIHTKGYQLRKLEIARGKLTNAREAHTTEIAKSKSLTSVRQAAIELNMVPTSKIVYLNGESEVALGTVPGNKP